MIIGVPKEIATGERRVALIPDGVKELCGRGVEVLTEAGAGVESGWDDAAYETAGARIAPDADALFAAATLVAKVRCPTEDRAGGGHELKRLRADTALVCVLQPFAHPDVVRGLADGRVSAFALDLMPRTTLAQSMDVLSSMSTIAGYKGVLRAADALPKFFPMLMTAAGTIRPARVLVLGAGVAGLQAIATARRLGAIVEAFDIRRAAKEQVESLGAKFIELEGQEDAEDAGGYAVEQTEEQLARQRQLVAERMAQADAVICTALVPGRRAPILMTRAEVESMRPGSVVVDLAAEQGGNCEVTMPGEIVRIGEVRVHGPLDLPSELSAHASQMFSKNVSNYLKQLVPGSELVVDLENELIRGPLVTHEGRIANERVAAELGA